MDRQTNGQPTFPLSNPEYDIISIMHHKLQAIGAYQTYLKDARGQQELTALIQKCMKQDQQDVEEFHRLLHAFHSGAGAEKGQTRAVGR